MGREPGKAASRGVRRITVADAIELPALRRGVPEVLAAHGQLGRTVRWVHSIEVRQIASVLKGGELLLTTGLGLGRDRQDRRALVAELAERAVAGLVLELGSVLPSAPEELRSECERCGIPLIVLHRPVPFVEVTEAIHGAIVNEQFALMRRADELARRFTDLMLGDAGIGGVLDALAEAVGNPAVLDRAGRGIAYRALAGHAESDVDAAWEANLRGLPGSPRALRSPVLVGGPAHWGHLTVLELGAPLDELTTVAVERAVAPLSLALAYESHDAILVRGAQRSLLTALAGGGIEESDAAARAVAAGFAAPAMLPVAATQRPLRDAAGAMPTESMMSALWRDVERELHGRRTPVLIGSGVGDQETLVVVGLARAEARVEAIERIAVVVASAAERRLGDRDAIVICAGPVARTWERLAEGLRLARATLPSAVHVPPRPWHDALAPDVDRVLWTLRGDHAVRSFVHARLDPVIDHDRRYGAELLRTLEQLCAHSGHKAETARALGITRPTLYNRITTLERLLGADLADAATLFGVDLAIRMRRHMRSDPA